MTAEAIFDVLSGSSCSIASTAHRPPPQSTIAGGHLVTQRHALEVIEEAAPVVGKHLRVLDSLLGPVLVPPGDVVLSVLEVNKLVPDALLHEHGTIVLVHNRLLVLLELLVNGEGVVKGKSVTCLDDSLNYLVNLPWLH